MHSDTHFPPIEWNHPTSATSLHHSWWKVHVNVNRSRLTMYKRLLFSRDSWYPQLPQRLCVTFMFIAFSTELSIYANYHLKPKWKSYQSISAFNFLNHCSVLCPSALSYGDGKSLAMGFIIGRCQELLESHKVTSCTMFLLPAVLPVCYVGVGLIRLHEKKTLVFFVSWRKIVFSKCPGSGWGWSGELAAVFLSAWSKDV